MNHRLSNPTDLLALIAQGESETVEFKRSVAGLEQVVKRGQAKVIGSGRASRYVA